MSGVPVLSVTTLISCFTVNPVATFPGSAAAQSCSTRSARSTALDPSSRVTAGVPVLSEAHGRIKPCSVNAPS